MRTLAHYTLDTGHLRESPRSEVRDDVLVALATMLSPGAHDVPGFGACRVLVSISGGTLRADIGGAAGPLATLWACTDAAGLALAASEAKHPAQLDLSLPACVVRLHATIAADPSTWSWLGDFERCLAWAWIARENKMR